MLRTKIVGVCCLAAALATTLTGTAGAAPARHRAATQSIAAVAPDQGAKPFSAGSIQIDADALAGGSPTVEVTTDPVAGASGATVSVAAEGAVTVTGGGAAQAVSAEESASSPATVAVTESPGAPADLPAAALADATSSKVVATLTATGSDGTALSSSDTVWAEKFDGQVIVSESGEQDLRLQRVNVLRSSGAVTDDEADTLEETILGATASTTAVAEGGCLITQVCVSGTVLWTDSAGGTHPVDRAPVQIRDEEAGVDEVVTTVATNGSGVFNATIDNNDGDATGRDVYVRVLAEGPGFTVAGDGASTSQHIDSAVTNNSSNGALLTKNMTANNTADNNTAFAIQASLVFAGDYIVDLNGSLFADVPVVFPASDGSFYDGTALHLLELDRWDWDVSLHEYGHFVADQLNIENNPGGPHSGSQNLSDARGSKSIGVPLAFGEGWPTFFAVSALFETASGLGIPNIGDTKYQDTEDQVITDDLEVNATLGEDNERTVMNILWDLYDSVDDNRDHVSLGAASIWNTLDDNDPTTLSEMYPLFSPAQGNEGTNCIFSQMNVSPKISGSATFVTDAPPTVRWRRGNGGTHANNKFVLKFYNAGGGLIFRTAPRTGTSMTPGNNRWATIIGAAGGTVQITVTGTQTDNPRTGPYRSCTRSYTID